MIIRILAVALLLPSLIGCESGGNQTPVVVSATATPTSIVAIKRYNNVWERMAADFSFKHHAQHPRVQRFIKYYSREDAYLIKIFSQQAHPYLYHIVQQLEENQMPMELALLPIIESEYRPQATSKVGAVGLWQLASLTGRLYGLKHDHWYDGRRDVDEATRAALGHLEFLYEKFDHDWLLALAAYNAGHGRVEQAIARNKRAGKPTDYWSLSLPKETEYFVPKFLALVYLIKNAEKHAITLAHIPNKPYFAQVTLDEQISLQRAADLAEVEVKIVKNLNAGYRNQVTHPKGPHQILLPVKSVATFKSNLATEKAKAKALAQQKAQQKSLQNKQRMVLATTASDSNVHVVNKGETLNKIANQYKTSVRALKTKNNLTSDMIRIGQHLAV